VSVQLVGHMGTDETVARSAWVSTDGDGRDAAPVDVERVIRALLSSRPIHAGPFGHPHLTVMVTCPIFVAREWMRHRTWSYSEMSDRYVDLSGEAYLPPISDFRTQVGKRIEYRTEPMAAPDAVDAQARMANSYDCSAHDYRELLRAGVAREVARNVLPLGTMTRFYATVSLRNALSFCALRNHEAALLEIRRDAADFEELLHTLWPVTMRVWTSEGRPTP
jgi:thymidylate synthase (FAD)